MGRHGSCRMVDTTAVDSQPMHVRVRWETGSRGFLYLFNQMNTVGPGSVSEWVDRTLLRQSDSNRKSIVSLKTKTFLVLYHIKIYKRSFFLLWKSLASFQACKRITAPLHITIPPLLWMLLSPSSRPLISFLFPASHLPCPPIYVSLLFSHAQWSSPSSILHSARTRVCSRNTISRPVVNHGCLVDKGETTRHLFTARMATTQWQMKVHRQRGQNIEPPGYSSRSPVASNVSIFSLSSFKILRDVCFFSHEYRRDVCFFVFLRDMWIFPHEYRRQVFLITYLCNIHSCCFYYLLFRRMSFPHDISGITDKMRVDLSIFFVEVKNSINERKIHKCQKLN